jgi:hypothetical protein
MSDTDRAKTPPNPGRITPREIEREMKESYLTYALSVIHSRALPDVRDGLKPSQRRILVAMNDLNLSPRAKYRKCAKIAGDTSGNYHPHGEAVIYPTLVRMAQDFSLRYPLIDGQVQAEHVPRAENNIADHLSKCTTQKLPVEPGTFVLHLTQLSVSPSTMARKRRKLDSYKYLPAGLPEAAGREAVWNNSALVGEQHPPMKPQVLAVEVSTPMNEEVPLVLVVEPQDPTWVQHIVNFLQTGELPEE